MNLSRKSIVGICTLVFMIACANLTPRRGWKPEYGPVVPHDTFPADCSLCHESGSWTKLKPDFEYDHEKETGVALGGAHRTAQCLMCHNDRGPVKQYADRGCQGCHEDVHRGRQGALCQECHNEDSWKPKEAIAQHMRTRFPLVGAHASTDCSQCHTYMATGNFQIASVSCETCHAADLTRSTVLDHASLGLNDRCDRCHTPVAWKPAGFDHPSSFPLRAGHATASCSDCHTTPGVFAGLSTDCASCHLPDFQATTDPNHVAANFSTNCTQCHSTSRWQGATFQHTATFALTNGHSNRSCNDCHTTPGTYAGLSTDCSSCHTDDFQRTTNPNHVTLGFGTNCTQCHNTLHWQGANFQHPASFTLTNGHAGRACTACHTTPGVYTGLSTSCASCHTDDFQATTNPNHVAASFSTNCLDCHNTTRWQGATFQHTPSFPLTNGHAGRSCTSCHTTPGVYTGLSTSCSSCHTDDYQRVTSPNHVTGGFSTNCLECHNTTRWQGANFQHAASFPLTNGHSNRACTLCHTTPGVYSGLSTTCSTCHLDDFQATTDPNHVTAGFSNNCLQCHTTVQWQGAVFQHAASFPLTNGHANRACNACHMTPGVYTGLSTTCSTCHLDDFQGTTNPNHVNAGFSTNCTQCHTTSQWQGAVFQHPASFPLTSAHANRSCTACHTTPGVYTGLSTDCASCHLDDYQATTNPNHTQLGYPTTCTTCHTPTLWSNATFNHPRINRGNHRNLACIDCHTVPAATPAFSCTHCHEHRRSSTDSDHSGVPNYQYLSSACYNCHD